MYDDNIYIYITIKYIYESINLIKNFSRYNFTAETLIFYGSSTKK